MSNNNPSDKITSGRDIHQKFLKLPESRSKKYYEEMKEHRMKYGMTKHKIDLRPRAFWGIMKVEIILLMFGVAFGISKHNTY
jgi:hypothetical protein